MNVVGFARVARVETGHALSLRKYTLQKNTNTMGEHTGSPLRLPSQKNTTYLMMWQNVGAYGIRPNENNEKK